MSYNKLKIELDVTNLEKSLEFYVDLAKFEIEYTREENKFVSLVQDDIHFMLQEVGNEIMNWKTGKLEYPFGRGVNFTLKPENIDEIYSNLINTEYALFKDIGEHWFKMDNGKESGLREFLVQDPDGYLLRFAKSLGDRDQESKK